MDVQHLLKELAWIGITAIEMDHGYDRSMDSRGHAVYTPNDNRTFTGTFVLHGEEQLETLAAVVHLARTVAPDSWEATLRVFAAQVMLMSKEKDT